MNREFIPYKEALALKALGFDESCFGYYNSQESFIVEDGKTNANCNKPGMNGTYCSTPLYQQAFRWFREKYSLIVQIEYLINSNYTVTIHKNTQEYMNTIQHLLFPCVDEIPDNYSYDEAEVAAIRKLVEIVKERKYK